MRDRVYDFRLHFLQGFQILVYLIIEGFLLQGENEGGGSVYVYIHVTYNHNTECY